MLIKWTIYRYSCPINRTEGDNHGFARRTFSAEELLKIAASGPCRVSRHRASPHLSAPPSPWWLNKRRRESATERAAPPHASRFRSGEPTGALLVEMPAVQPLSAFVSNHCSTRKKRMTIGNRWTRPNSGELLQTNVIEPTTQQETRPKLHTYKEGTLSLLVAGRR
jgi:hypothetical protein